nr:teichuronic acid biosynthesis protein TuaB [Hafnia alvei]
MLAIFIAIGQVFIDSGFSSALIRKNDRSNIDYSTAFYFNIFVAVIFYIVLFITSPFISDFYQQPELTSLTKVIGLSLIINSFTLVPRTILTVSMNFKAQAKASICSVIIGGVIALTLAKCGYGVWALVAQTLSMALCNAVFLNVVAKWIPSLNFSKESFSYLFGFGGKLLASGLLDTAYNNLYQIVIGKKFDVVNVGQYTQANQISSIPAMTMTNVIQRVTYPMFSHMQDNHKKMQEYYLLTIKVAALFIFPLMAGIAIISKPLIHMFLGSQWGEASNLIMVLAFAYMLYPIHAINLNILQVKGRSDLFLKLEVIKKILGLAIIAITMQVGILYMCIGLLFHSYISLILNTYYTEKLTGLKIKNQVKEIFPIWIITLISSFIAWTSANYLSEADTIQVISMICIAVVIYLTLICLTQKKVVKIILSIKNQG